MHTPIDNAIEASPAVQSTKAVQLPNIVVVNGCCPSSGQRAEYTKFCAGPEAPLSQGCCCQRQLCYFECVCQTERERGRERDREAKLPSEEWREGMYIFHIT